jgi:serine/threonine protein kinase
MGVDFEFMTDSNGRPQIYFIDKGKKTVDVGNKLSDFTIQRELGKGHFGSVCLVVSNKTKKLYAMKQIKSSMYKSQNYLEVEREVKLLENLSHPHVITYFSSFKENNDFYIVTEYINNGSLLDLMKKNIQQKKHIEEKTIWILLIQSLGGLLYLHQNKKIVHRDIKPDNLLLDMNGNLKISDFGLSAIISEEADEIVKCHNTVAGAIQFMAPEVAMGKKYDFKSDLYMLGLTFFLLTTNRLPEKKLDMGICIIPIKYEDAKMPDYYSENLKKVINKLLIVNPEERPSTRKAYFEAITYYSIKYLKVTSFIASLQCLYSIPSFFLYFKSGKVKTIIENNENTNDKKYIVTKAFQTAFNICEPLNCNFKLAESECIKLRILIYGNKEHH